MKNALLFLERQARDYRRTWRFSIISTFLNPILLLLAMGVGLGSLVEEGPAGLPYVTWLAPGLLAAAAMQTAAGDSAFSVMAGIKWLKTYDAALATPLDTRSIVWGQLGWSAVRLVMVSTVYALVMVAFGATDPLESLLAIGPAILTGLAFSSPVMAYTARLEDDSGIASLFRFGIVPLFLFSGTFFPISQLPAWMQPLAALTPLWHGVELTRWTALGLPTAYPPLVHVAVLVIVFAVFARLAARLLEQRMVK